ncbi:MAG: 50S ribosomal protein L22 [Synechococcales cyanobacterium]
MILAPNETQAQAKYIRMSPYKVRRILDQIRGKSYADALILLKFMPHAACDPVRKALRSAVANAEHNRGFDARDLIVSQAFADQGPTLKRFKARAQGRAYPIHKRTCHITVAVMPAPVDATTEENA